ncbi:adenosylcobinamide amidohydrolase [Paenibacillus mendelii]|uniref:Adenosylcobinamide amidohydrolase n=1 Tax=Paenibacillus mendelii TaxID=206163 RepID=A0ABV6JHI4_9BACL|nr:adenosylcobinamide amidohydrolase [Paenibacillus mendelii]MCQ6557808.1 adenosylcobinamide amidohydrolase [Paenibacillus mendelii]
MSQPFRNKTSFYTSQAWPDLTIEWHEERIVISSKNPLQSLSSAVYGGGLGLAERFVNWKVPLDYDCGDPVHDFRSMFAEWGYPEGTTVGYMTAAKLTHASVLEEAGDQFAIVCLTTSGIGNAARAGVRRPSFSAYTAGTINIFLMIDGRMSSSAMVNAVIMATEAKAAALQELDIADPLIGGHATGTTTDAILVAVSQSDRYESQHLYAGAATTIGNAIGRLVYETVYESVATRSEP